MSEHHDYELDNPNLLPIYTLAAIYLQSSMKGILKCQVICALVPLSSTNDAHQVWAASSLTSEFASCLCNATCSAVRSLPCNITYYL